MKSIFVPSNLGNFKKYLLSVAFALALGCSSDSGSSGGSGGSNGGNGGTGGDPAAGASCENYTPIPNAFDSSNRHIYLGEFRLDSGSSAQGAYRAFLNDFGKFCKNDNNSFKWQYNPNTGRWEYAYYYTAGSANCSNWDDFLKLWIIFPRNDSRRAHLVVDATLSGYPNGWNGQGFDVQRMSLPNAQIDCREEEDTDIYFEPRQGFRLKVNIYQGTKNSERLRAEVFYKNGSIGKTDFFILQR